MKWTAKNCSLVRVYAVEEVPSVIFTIELPYCLMNLYSVMPT